MHIDYVQDISLYLLLAAIFAFENQLMHNSMQVHFICNDDDETIMKTSTVYQTIIHCK